MEFLIREKKKKINDTVYYKEEDSLTIYTPKSKAKLLRWELREGKEELLSMAHVNKKYPEDNVIKFWKN